MDWARLVLDYLQALAWPLVVLALAFMFRKQFAGLIDGISEVTAPGNFSIKRRASALRVEAEEASSETLAAVTASDDERTQLEGSSELDRYVEAADTDPVGAISGAWRVVRNSVRDTTRRLGTDRELGPGAYTTAHVRTLVPLGLSEDMVSVARQLSGLRNDVVHGRRVRTNSETALEYLAAADDLLRAVYAVESKQQPARD